LKRVSINFDASKLPFQIKFGAPEQGVLFVRSKFLSIENAKHDALMKVGQSLVFTLWIGTMKSYAV
jgi:hypothetical protein